MTIRKPLLPKSIFVDNLTKGNGSYSDSIQNAALTDKLHKIIMRNFKKRKIIPKLVDNI